jgi:hypothetical protein
VYFALRLDGLGNWGINQRVDDTASPASSPVIAVDSSGNADAAWVDSRRGDTDIWFSERSASTGIWSASVRVNDDAAGSTQSAPAIAVSSTGEAIAIWVDGRSKKANVYAARLAPGGCVVGKLQSVTGCDVDEDHARAGHRLQRDDLRHLDGDENSKGSLRFTTLPTGSTTWAADTLLSDATRNQAFGQIRVDTQATCLLPSTTAASLAWARASALPVPPHGVRLRIWLNHGCVRPLPLGPTERSGFRGVDRHQQADLWHPMGCE